MDDLTVTSQRSQVVDFSAPYETSTLEVMLQVCTHLQGVESKSHPLQGVDHIIRKCIE